MSYETEEQQVEALKEWWKENGTPLVVGAILGLAGFGGWKYWSQQQITYQENASDLYGKVSEILKNEDKKGLVESAQAVKTTYPDSSYAILSAFQLAKLAVNAGELDKAASELTWVIDNHKDNEMVNVAKIRLARILIQQDKNAEALALVNIDEESGYYGLASLVKGDALIAMGKNKEGLEAYQAASADLTIAARHPSLQLKIDELSVVNSNIPSVAIETNSALAVEKTSDEITEKDSSDASVKKNESPTEGS